jgi:membrane protease YdiL (CAAX protease family)
MRAVRALGVYIIFVFIGGALLAPVLYWSVQSFGQSFPVLSEISFHRFVKRSFLALGLIGLWPLFRSLGAKSWNDLGLVSNGQKLKSLRAGFTLGFVSLAIVAAVALGVGARTPASNIHNVAQKVTGAALTAIVVATLEEILFRGGIFGALRRNLNWLGALLLSSAIYALVHFLGNPHQAIAVSWHSGLDILPRMFEGFANWQQLVPGFFNLMLAGSILALSYHRLGNLYFSIGLHAGWIFWLKGYGSFTRETPGANTWIWGGTKMIDGWLGLLVLTATLLGIMYLSAPDRDTASRWAGEVPT